MITSVLRSIGNNKFIVSGFKSIGNKEFILKQAAKLGDEKKFSKYVTNFGIASICLKDGLGCYYYVTQSLKNDRIPEEKRKFVAALDLANGILMIATQLTLGLAITSDKCQNWLKDKFFKNILDEKEINKFFKEIKKVTGFEKLTETPFNKSMEGVSKHCLGGLKVLTALGASTIVAKRMIVPFISTPIASWYKEKYMDKNCKQLPQLIGQSCFDTYIANRNKKS